MDVRLRREQGRMVARQQRASPRIRDRLRAARVALLAVGVPYGSALRLTSWTWLVRVRTEPSPRRARRWSAGWRRRAASAPHRRSGHRGATTSPLRSFGVT
jgi:hypothetical protein